MSIEADIQGDLPDQFEFLEDFSLSLPKSKNNLVTGQDETDFGSIDTVGDWRLEHYHSSNHILRLMVIKQLSYAVDPRLTYVISKIFGIRMQACLYYNGCLYNVSCPNISHSLL